MDHKKHTMVLLTALLLMTTAVPVLAVQDQPRPSIGFAGGPVYSIALIPDRSSTVLVGTGTGIYKSINGQDIWKPSNEGLASTYIYDIVPNTITATILYAATKEGVSKSTDDGVKWTSSGLSDYQVYTLAVNPVTTTYLVAGAAEGVFTSTDGGTNWTKEATGPPNTYGLAINPKAPLTVYAGSFGEGVYKSSNFGTTWSATGSGPKNVNAVIINPSTTSMLYTATDAGIYKSTNDGSTWSLLSGDFSVVPVYGLAIHSSNPSIVYAATDKGVYKTTNDGTSWTSMNSGIPTQGLNGPFVREIIIDPRTPTTLYAGIYSGVVNDVDVYKSTDSGSSWTQMNRELSNTIVYSLAFDPEDSAVVYAGTSTLGVLKSTSAGQSWVEANEGFTSYLVRAVAVHPETATIYGGSSSGLFISADSGETWEAASPNPEIYSLAIDPFSTDNIYTGTNRGIFLTTDEGETWSPLNNNLTNPYVYAIAFHPQNSGELYVGTDGDGVFKSVSGGAGWEPVNEGIDSLQVLSLAIAPKSPYPIFAGTREGGIFMSTDSGATWTTLSAYLAYETITSIAINPDDTDIMYAGTEGQGFFKSTNAGLTWSIGDEDIYDKTVYYLCLDPQDSQTLFVALAGDVKIYSINTPPDKPYDPIPENGAVDQPTTPTLSWSGSDPDPGDSVTYEVYFGTEEEFDDNSSMTTVATPSFTPETLELSRTYYWKVSAIDSKNARTEGDVWSFSTIISNPPLAPASPSPANGATNQTLWRLSLSWSGSDPDSGDTLTYDVYFGITSEPPLVRQNLDETTYSPIQPLLPMTTYYWKIVARDNNGLTTEGEVWHFKTKLLPGECLAERVLEKDRPALDLLRRFRDRVLLQTRQGRELVNLYYMVSPSLIERVEQSPELEKALRAEFYRFLPELEKVLRTPEVTALDRQLLNEAARLLKTYVPGVAAPRAY